MSRVLQQRKHTHNVPSTTHHERAPKAHCIQETVTPYLLYQAVITTLYSHHPRAPSLHKQGHGLWV